MAVTKARQEREKMKAEEWKKKLVKQHEDMKKVSEMISRHPGDGGRGDNSRRPDMHGNDRGGQPWTNNLRMHLRVSHVIHCMS